MEHRIAALSVDVTDMKTSHRQYGGENDLFVGGVCKHVGGPCHHDVNFILLCNMQFKMRQNMPNSLVLENDNPLKNGDAQAEGQKQDWLSEGGWRIHRIECNTLKIRSFLSPAQSKRRCNTSAYL